MNTLTQSPGLWTRTAHLLGTIMRSAKADRPPEIGPREEQDRHSDRRLIDELIRENPEAFASELDIQHMMHLFPHRY